jgi:hypothetical protein
MGIDIYLYIMPHKIDPEEWKKVYSEVNFLSFIRRF